MKGSGLTIKRMVMGNIYTLMEQSTKGNGSKISSME